MNDIRKIAIQLAPQPGDKAILEARGFEIRAYGGDKLPATLYGWQQLLAIFSVASKYLRAKTMLARFCA